MKKNKTLTKASALSMALVLTLGSVGTLDVCADENVNDKVYVTMNVPYSDFYKAYNVTDAAVWEVEEGIDAVSTATTGKFAQTTGLANGTYNDGKYIKGVTIPVALDSNEYEAIKDYANKTDKEDYFFSALESKPSYYSEVEIAEGKLVFDKFANAEYDNPNFTVKGYSTSSRYGDYQISLGGFSPAKKITVSEEQVLENANVYGVILKTTDNDACGMTVLENLWLATRLSDIEVAFSTKNGKGLTGRGNRGKYYQFDINGKTLSSVDVITNYGVFTINKFANGENVANTLKLDKYYEGDLSALSATISNDSDVLSIKGLPTDFENVKVSINGLCTDAEVVDGKVKLDKAPVDGTNYTVNISSSNYANISLTVATPVSEAQVADLNKWIAKAKAVANYAEKEELKTQVENAESAKTDKNATSVTAANAIKSLMSAVKKNYEKFEVVAALNGKKLKVELTGAEVSKLENATYSLTYKEGRMTTTLASGVLDKDTVEIDAEPVLETEYTLTIVSDNYQDVSVAVVAKEAINDENKDDNKDENKDDNKNDNKDENKDVDKKDNTSNKTETKKDDKKDNTKTDVAKEENKNAVKVGDKVTVGGVIYKVTDVNKKIVEAVGLAKKNAKSVKIAASVKVGKDKFKVTAVANKAFFKSKLTKVTIGANVVTIGKQAFAKSKKLKTVIVKSKNIKKVLAKAFAGTSKKIKVKVPAKKLKTYKKLFKKGAVKASKVVK